MIKQHNNNCKILGIDLLELKKIQKVEFIKGDIFDEKIIKKFLNFLRDQKLI